jgi:hypothetical protein
VLTTAGVIALSTAGVPALMPASVAALTTACVAALTTAEVSVMTPDQVTALTTTQCMALTSDQISAFGSNTIYLATLSSPIVLDLNGNGITTQSIMAGTKFDLLATGQVVDTGWVAGGDGLLVYDPNNGPITSGSQLFGTSTLLPNGQKAANGFDALSVMDANGDGSITSADTGWSDLKIWVDANSDGTSQTGELKTLDSLGITKLNLSATASSAQDNGNILGLLSSFETSDGQTHAMADVWFNMAKNQSANASVTPVAATSAVQSLVAASNTAQAAALTTDQIAALIPSQAAALSASAGLQSQVGGLAQAIGAFSQSQSATVGFTGTPVIDVLPASTLVASPVPALSVNVAGMVGALQQFDPNGNPAGVAVIANSVTTGTTLLTSPLSNPANNGILVVGK